MYFLPLWASCCFLSHTVSGTDSWLRGIGRRPITVGGAVAPHRQFRTVREPACRDLCGGLLGNWESCRDDANHKAAFGGQQEKVVINDEEDKALRLLEGVMSA